LEEALPERGRLEVRASGWEGGSLAGLMLPIAPFGGLYLLQKKARVRVPSGAGFMPHFGSNSQGRRGRRVSLGSGEMREMAWLHGRFEIAVDSTVVTREVESTLLPFVVVVLFVVVKVFLVLVVVFPGIIVVVSPGSIVARFRLSGLPFFAPLPRGNRNGSLPLFDGSLSCHS